MRTLAVGLLFVLLAGCGGSQPDGSQFQHDEAAKLFLEAMKIRETDQARALALLNQSIVARPSYNAYYHRAWLHALQGDEQKAAADLKSGLELEPESKELQWLDKELQKPVKERKLDKPPSSVK
jgi:Tfp pilus assembly protein PilF